MSQLFRETAQSLPALAELTMGGMTALFMALFLGWIWYAFAPSRSEHMQTMAHLPLDDGDAS